MFDGFGTVVVVILLFMEVQRPEGAISKVLFGGQMTEEEAESLLQR